MPLFLIKLISAFLLPIPITLLLLLFALLLKRYRTLLILSAAVLLISSSLSITAEALTNALEQPYRPLNKLPDDVTTVVVLGGGVRYDTSDPANTQLNSASLARLIESIRLYQSKKNNKPTVLLSGGKVFESPDETGALHTAASFLGVDKKDIRVISGSRNTQEEASRLAKVLKHQHFALVTSATHMKRALYLFKKAGMNPIPAPTQFLSRDDSPQSLRYWLPRASNCVRVDIAIHEFLGLLYAKWFLS